MLIECLMAKKGLYMGYLIRKASVDELEQIAYLDSECERETYKHIFNKDYLRTLTANTCKDFWYKEFKKIIRIFSFVKKMR